MSYLLSLLRTVLGWMLRFLDRVTRPSPIDRSEEKQNEVEDQLERMALYQFEG